MSSLPDRRPSRAEIIASDAYVALRDEVIAQATAARGRAARAVNTELVLLYWGIGRTILAEQRRLSWGDDVVGLLAQDLRAKGQLGRGFSRRNLFYMRSLAALWPEREKVQSVIAQIGWTHHIQLLDAFGSEPDLYAWYVAKTVEHRWTVRQLKGQIDLKLHLRTGAATTNFVQALGDVEAGAALAATKDPYVLDFIDLAEDAKERELEAALVRDIPRFLRELGMGFAYYGRQQPFELGGQEFFIDLVFYHHRLRRFVVIDLKIGEFKVEYAGKMNLYLNAVDAQLRHPDDGESIGLILCTSHNATVAKFALHRSGAPIGVANWQTDPNVDVADNLPESLRDELGDLPEVRDRLTRHVADAATRVEGRMLEVGGADQTASDG
ncbi:MAG: PDDEXK nuclease domain-containing protein [Actinomycetota bacterium]|nr:PDDEXK nuclease domain-containing protein [Actinomycetota bacterium]